MTIKQAIDQRAAGKRALEIAKERLRQATIALVKEMEKLEPHQTPLNLLKGGTALEVGTDHRLYVRYSYGPVPVAKVNPMTGNLEWGASELENVREMYKDFLASYSQRYDNDRKQVETDAAAIEKQVAELKEAVEIRNASLLPLMARCAKHNRIYTVDKMGHCPECAQEPEYGR